MLTFIMLVLWIVSLVALVIEFSAVWLLIFIITTIFLIVKGAVLIGFDLDDLL